MNLINGEAIIFYWKKLKRYSYVLLITSLQQKQSPEVFYEKRFSQKFLKIHSVGVNKVAGLRPEPY